MIDRLNSALDGRYRVERELGEGGMATVYLAEDIKHDRQVAIKVLKPELAAVIGGERFVTEIKTTAALQHPHILPLFDSGSTDGFLYYVMPYVEGESLREKLDREKQLGVDEAVKIAVAVASAVHYAHEQGIVHRDIKPANILIHAGEPVVADFGIALAISAAGGGRLTETGMSVGTPHYMSPEQASPDGEVSGRSDTYALASVLYEMLAGEPPHTGSTAQAVLMRILTEEPRDISDVRKSVPAHVRDAIMKGLEKLPADRFATAEAFKAALTDPSFRRQPAAGKPESAGTWTGAAGWGRDIRSRVLLGTCILLVAALAWALLRAGGGTSRPPGAVHRYAVQDSQQTGPRLSISRQGDVVYRANAEGRDHLRIRRAGDPQPREIPNTEDASGPSFSPDGAWVAFMENQRSLKKIQLATGTTVTLVPEGVVNQMFTTAWTDDGTVLMAGAGGIYRVPDIGGEPEQIADVPAVFPQLLPGGRSILYTEIPTNDPAAARVMVRDLETGDTVLVASPAGNAVWSPTGHILYGHASATIFALPFDLDRGAVTGPPVPVQENVFTFGAISAFDLSPSGDLAYVGGTGTTVDFSVLEFAWLDLDGELTPIPLDPTDHDDARISPDGLFLAYTRDSHIYIFDLDRGTNQRLTFEGGNHHNPVWSPDGLRIAFASEREDGRGGTDIYAKAVDGRTPAEWIAGTENLEYPGDWLEDGTLLVFSTARVGEQTDILMATVGGDGQPQPLLQADWNEGSPIVSPDGRFMAYASTETGENQLFVRGFPDMGGRWQVSERPVEGPSFWAPSGDAIYYEITDAPDLIRAELEFEPTFRVVSRTVVADQHEIAALRDIHPDGQRLLVTQAPASAEFQAAEEQLLVVVNWLTELRRRLGEAGAE